MSELVNKIEQLVRNQFQDEATGHDWYHIERVWKNARFIQQHEGGNLELIELAALLHDISDYKFNGGNELAGGKKSIELILANGGSEELAIQIAKIVDSVSFKGAHVQDSTYTLEAKIVQDADRLDALGAIGIARTFAYGGHTGQPIYDPTIQPNLHHTFEEYKNSRSHTINHFHEKLLLLSARLHTTTAKKIGEQRTELMKQFLVDFHKEWNNELAL